MSKLPKKLDKAQFGGSKGRLIEAINALIDCVEELDKVIRQTHGYFNDHLTGHERGEDRLKALEEQLQTSDLEEAVNSGRLVQRVEALEEKVEKHYHYPRGLGEVGPTSGPHPLKPPTCGECADFAHELVGNCKAGIVTTRTATPQRTCFRSKDPDKPASQMQATEKVNEPSLPPEPEQPFISRELEEGVRRISLRRTCKECGDVYRQHWISDGLCGRCDDTMTEGSA